jgi:uncharacterized protein (DUF2345 family)
MNSDHIDHFCSAIQLLNEGGSKITEPNAGITSDMTGRWTIAAFDTSKKNKKETPAMKEALYSNNAGIMEVFKFFNMATDEQKKQFDELVSGGNQNAALKLVEKVLGIEFKGDLTLEHNADT